MYVNTFYECISVIIVHCPTGISPRCLTSYTILPMAVQYGWISEERKICITDRYLIMCMNLDDLPI